MVTDTVTAELATVRDAIYDIGTTWTGPTADKVLEIYKSLHARLPGLVGSTSIIKDIKYGPAERNVLDVFVPAGVATPTRSVLVYFHGGGFFAGDKMLNNVVYSNIGYYFAKHGYVTIIANYQLVPHCSYPAPADDVQLVREWTYANISSSQYGSGNVNKVVIIGQSAGGSHIATNLYARGDPNRAKGSDALSPPLAGVAYLSTPFSFDHTKARRAQTLREYYGSDQPEEWKDRCPLGLFQALPKNDIALSPRRLPTLLTVGELDPQEIVDGNILFFNAYRQKSLPQGILPLFHVLPSHNHISNVFSIGTEDDAQGQILRDFAERCCPGCVSKG